MPVLKLLLIDDDPEELEIFEEAAHRADPSLSVFHWRDPSYCATCERCVQPDLIFLDINMAGQDGFAWLKHLKQGACRVPVIMFSTSSNAQTIARSYQLGADLYLTKPLSFTALIEALRTIVHFDWSNPQAITSQFLKEGCFYPLS